jgi:hypothetical protein
LGAPQHKGVGKPLNMLRRLAAAGGWLAYIANQDSDYNPDMGRRRYPGLVLVPIVVGGFLGTWPVYWLVVLLAGGAPAPGGFLLWAAFELCTGGLALLLVIGWLSHFLPFADTRDPCPTPVEGIGQGEEVVVHATGVLQIQRPIVNLRRRRAVLLWHGEDLVLAPDRWHANTTLPIHSRTLAVVPLTHDSVTRLRRGNAFLVGGPRPAICFRWKFGPLTLDFDDQPTRDRVYATLASRPAS